MTNSVNMSKIKVFIGGTALIWLKCGILCESSVSCSDEFLSVSEMLKYIWSSTGSSVSTRNESRPAEVFLFETKLWFMSFDKASSIDDISKLGEFVFINRSHILSMSVRFFFGSNKFYGWQNLEFEQWICVILVISFRYYAIIFFIRNYRMWLHFNNSYRIDKLTLSQWLFYNMLYFDVSDRVLCTICRLRRCRRDCKTVQVKVIKYYSQPYGSCQLKLSTQLKVCRTVNKGKRRFLKY